MKRVLALLAVLSVLAPVVAAPVVAAGPTTLGETELLSEPHSAVSGVPDNSTANGTATTPEAASTPGDRPPAAEVVRILPVRLESDIVSVSTADQNNRYNTSGPFALFSLSEPVEQVAISQEKASATVLEGGRTVKVEYADDAAPVGSASLYKLRLYFEDGSSKTVELMAERTSVSVGSASMKKYRPFIMDVLNDAENNGYERSPDGVEQHYKDVQETAQLLDSMFGTYAKRLFGSILSIFMNPLGIAAVLVLAALVALWQLRNNKQTLDILSNDEGKAARLRERLWIAYQEQQQTAADEPLSEVIGEMNAIYWSDAFGVDSTAQLAELFRTGLPVQRNGEIKHVGGADDLSASDISESWIEAVCRENRIPSPELALTDGKKVLHRMITRYGMAHHYQESYEQVREVLEALDESRDVTRHSASASSGFGSDSSLAGGAPSGGDD